MSPDLPTPPVSIMTGFGMVTTGNLYRERLAPDEPRVKSALPSDGYMDSGYRRPTSDAH